MSTNDSTKKADFPRRTGFLPDLFYLGLGFGAVSIGLLMPVLGLMIEDYPARMARLGGEWTLPALLVTAGGMFLGIFYFLIRQRGMEGQVDSLASKRQGPTAEDLAKPFQSFQGNLAEQAKKIDSLGKAFLEMKSGMESLTKGEDPGPRLADLSKKVDLLLAAGKQTKPDSVDLGPLASSLEAARKELQGLHQEFNQKMAKAAGPGQANLGEEVRKALAPLEEVKQIGGLKRQVQHILHAVSQKPEKAEKGATAVESKVDLKPLADLMKEGHRQLAGALSELKQISGSPAPAAAPVPTPTGGGQAETLRQIQAVQAQLVDLMREVRTPKQQSVNLGPMEEALRRMHHAISSQRPQQGYQEIKASLEQLEKNLGSQGDSQSQKVQQALEGFRREVADQLGRLDARQREQSDADRQRVLSALEAMQTQSGRTLAGSLDNLAGKMERTWSEQTSRNHREVSESLEQNRKDFKAEQEKLVSALSSLKETQGTQDRKWEQMLDQLLESSSKSQEGYQQGQEKLQASLSGLKDSQGASASKLEHAIDRLAESGEKQASEMLARFTRALSETQRSQVADQDKIAASLENFQNTQEAWAGSLQQSLKRLLADSGEQQVQRGTELIRNLEESQRRYGSGQEKIAAALNQLQESQTARIGQLEQAMGKLLADSGEQQVQRGAELIRNLEESQRRYGAGQEKIAAALKQLQEDQNARTGQLEQAMGKLVAETGTQHSAELAEQCSRLLAASKERFSKGQEKLASVLQSLQEGQESTVRSLVETMEQLGCKLDLSWEEMSKHSHKDLLEGLEKSRSQFEGTQKQWQDSIQSLRKSQEDSSQALQQALSGTLGQVERTLREKSSGDAAEIRRAVEDTGRRFSEDYQKLAESLSTLRRDQEQAGKSTSETLCDALDSYRKDQAKEAKSFAEQSQSGIQQMEKALEAARQEFKDEQKKIQATLDQLQADQSAATTFLQEHSGDRFLKLQQSMDVLLAERERLAKEIDGMKDHFMAAGKASSQSTRAEFLKFQSGLEDALRRSEDKVHGLRQQVGELSRSLGAHSQDAEKREKQQTERSEALLQALESRQDEKYYRELRSLMEKMNQFLLEKGRSETEHRKLLNTIEEARAKLEAKKQQMLAQISASVHEVHGSVQSQAERINHIVKDKLQAAMREVSRAMEKNWKQFGENNQAISKSLDAMRQDQQSTKGEIESLRSSMLSGEHLENLESRVDDVFQALTHQKAFKELADALEEYNETRQKLNDETQGALARLVKERDRWSEDLMREIAKGNKSSDRAADAAARAVEAGRKALDSVKKDKKKDS